MMIFRRMRGLRAPLMKFSAVALAFASSSHAAWDMKSCSDPGIDLRLVPVGFQCLSSRGAVFTRVAGNPLGEAWRDPEGRIWGDHLGNTSQEGAVRVCGSIGATLPSNSDYDRGEQEGIREVLPGW